MQKMRTFQRLPSLYPTLQNKTAGNDPAPTIIKSTNNNAKIVMLSCLNCQYSSLYTMP